MLCVSFKVNSFWAILELVKPIKLSQVRPEIVTLHTAYGVGKMQITAYHGLSLVEPVAASLISNLQVSTLEPFYLLREGDHDKEAFS